MADAFDPQNFNHAFESLPPGLKCEVAYLAATGTRRAVYEQPLNQGLNSSSDIQLVEEARRNLIAASLQGATKDQIHQYLLAFEQSHSLNPLQEVRLEYHTQEVFRKKPEETLDDYLAHTNKVAELYNGLIESHIDMRARGYTTSGNYPPLPGNLPPRPEKSCNAIS